MFAVLDTNHFRELTENSPAGQRLQEKIKVFAPGLFSCIIAAEESLQGRISFIRGKQSGVLQVEG